MSFSRAFDLFMSPLAVPASGSGGGVGGAGAGGPLSGGLDGTASSGLASVKGGLGPLHGSTTNGAGSPVANGSGSNSSNGGFFIPSYLRNSTYVQRLAAAHEARQRAIREGLLTHPAPAAVRSASVSNGVVAGAVASKAPDPGVVSIGPSPCYGPGLTRPLPARMTHPGRRRTLPQDVGQPSPSSKQRGAGGSTFDLVSRTGGAAAGATYNPYALEYEDETLTPLPSRWNPSDKWGGLEVLGPDGLEVKHTATRSGSERDHEACSIRADHFIPPQCGFYYFEVTILTRKRDEYVYL